MMENNKKKNKEITPKHNVLINIYIYICSYVYI